ncbi:U1 small nuclear ribonucleoprotein C [Daucus carota subsp. sativus]|uniref:U1 small nuclear ribonucleoprotein C n=1 Tax=Daucus carota subsp. sativus TaxID=79200 RepID=UPI0007B2FE6B|nr:PREDICTED: U1 small nuclear ribonucleoprotein C-like [Daucus carota subsp. sativus]
MPRYYCDYCDTYLTHDSPSVRKQHNAGYKHKANVREYYQQYEQQQHQILIDERIKAHLGQAAAFQQVGAAYNQMRPRMAVLPTPMMPMPGNPQMAMTGPLLPGMRPPVLMRPAYMPGPGMPPMTTTPPGAPPLPGQGQVDGAPRPMLMNPPPIVPGSAPASSAAFTPVMYQANPNPVAPSGGFDSSNVNAQPQAAESGH